ncbi:MAG: hypothetical protein WCK60_02125 [Candidatus Nomurabacteria bacterium]
MRKLTKKYLLATFLETYSYICFCEEHLEIVGSLLTKRGYLNWNSITENIRFVSQEKANIKHTSSVEISRRNNIKVLIKITSMGGIDTFEIDTEISIDEITELIKRSTGSNEFAVRKISTASVTLKTDRKLPVQQTWIPSLNNISMEQKRTGPARHVD